MKIPVAIKILNETTGPKANVEFMDVSNGYPVPAMRVHTHYLWFSFTMATTYSNLHTLMMPRENCPGRTKLAWIWWQNSLHSVDTERPPKYGTNSVFLKLTELWPTLLLYLSNSEATQCQVCVA